MSSVEKPTKNTSTATEATTAATDNDNEGLGIGPMDIEEKPTEVTDVGDDNDEIMRLLSERLALGRQRYGHGMRVDEDPTQYGVASNDWELMALEELLDGLIYTTAGIIRHMRRKKKVAGNQ